MPMFYPGNTQETLDYGLLRDRAVALVGRVGRR